MWGSQTPGRGLLKEVRPSSQSSRGPSFGRCGPHPVCLLKATVPSWRGWLTGQTTSAVTDRMEVDPAIARPCGEWVYVRADRGNQGG